MSQTVNSGSSGEAIQLPSAAMIPSVEVKLSVRQTSLSCDFLGLFAEHFIAKDTLVCVYTGNVLRTKEALHLEDKSYLMRLGEQCYVDAKDDLSILARYINDCITPMGWNVRFDKQPSLHCAYVIAIRDIYPGEEIFVDYGKWYWVKMKPVKLPAKHLLDIQARNTATAAAAVASDGIVHSESVGMGLGEGQTNGE